MTEAKDKLMKTIINKELTEEQMERAYLLLTTAGQKLPESQPLGFLTIKDAMKYGKISRNTLYRWLEKGLKSYPVGGRRLLLAKDIDVFVISQSASVTNSTQGVTNHE